MVLKGRRLGGFSDLDDFWGDFNNQNIILRVLKYKVNRSGELAVLSPMNNLSADDREVILVTRNSRLARLGKIRPGTDELKKIVPLDLAQWDPEFLGALRSVPKDELYIWFVTPADDLGPKLRINLLIPVGDWLQYPEHQDAQHQHGQVPLELPQIAVDGAGNLDAAALLSWFYAANRLAQARPGLSFGNLAGSLPGELRVSQVYYQPGFTRYKVGVFPKISDVRVVERAAGGTFMIEILDAQMNRGAGGLFYRRDRNPAEEEDPVESIEVKELLWPDYIKQLREEIVEGLTKRMVLSIINHGSGTLVVDNMEVESIKRVCKKGKKLYRMFLKGEEGGSLNSHVNTGSYIKCSFWLSSVWSASAGANN